jgi:Zn-finger nucleic acid-binding protein
MNVTLACPKCGSEMRQYERNQVVVDQCTGCGGLFLDRGEIERLVAAENQWHQQAATPPPPPQHQAPAQHQQGGYQQGGYRDGGYQQGGYQQGGYPGGYRKKKKSFLSELFDD